MRRIPALLLSAGFLAFALMSNGTPAGALQTNCTLFASPSGGGTGATASSPTTFSGAHSAAVAGSVVCLKAGTYNFSSNFILNKSGTAAAPITYEGYGDGTALVQYNGVSRSGGIWQTPSSRPWASTHNVIIQDLTFDGASLIGSAVFLHYGTHHITLRRNTVRNTGATGFALMASDYITVDHNLFSHIGYNQGWSSAISLWYGGGSSSGTSSSCTWGGNTTAWYDTASGFHNIIADNIISGTVDNSSNHSDGNGIIIDGCGSIPPALIINNLSYENGGRGIVVIHNTGNVWLVNNTGYANGLDLRVGSGQAPDFMAQDTTNTHFTNNVAYGRKNGSNFTTAYIYNNTSSTIQWRKDIGFNGSTPGVSSTTLNDPAQYRTADPQFTNRPAVPTSSTPWTSAIPPWSIGDDLTVTSTSPAVDTGIDPATLSPPGGFSSWFTTDLAGNPRVMGAAVDVGAYEQGSVPPPPPPPPPATASNSSPRLDLAYDGVDSLTATANPNVSAGGSVKFYVNDVLVSTQTTAPFAYTVTETGDLALKAVATETDGDTGDTTLHVTR